MRTVAALYVAARGCYFGLPGVDPWDEARDARLYAGPHPARKATWLYAFGVDLPPLRWGSVGGSVGGAWKGAAAVVSQCRNHSSRVDGRPRIYPREAAASPPEFRDALLSIARTARRQEAA